MSDMSTRSVVILCTLLSLCALAGAAPIIVVGDHVLEADTPGQIVNILIAPAPGDSESVNFRGVNLYAQVGDGGPELADYGLTAGTDGPAITTVDLKPDGGILSGFSDPAWDLGGIPQAATWSFVFTGGDALRPRAEGLLAELVIDTTGFHEGVWELKLAGVLDWPSLGGPFDTDLAGIHVEIANGHIIVPEPAVLTLLLAATTVFASKRR